MEEIDKKYFVYTTPGKEQFPLQIYYQLKAGYNVISGTPDISYQKLYTENIPNNAPTDATIIRFTMENNLPAIGKTH